MPKQKLDILVPYPFSHAPSQRFRIELFIKDLKETYDVNVFSFWSEKTWKILYKKGYIFAKIMGLIGGFGKRKLYLLKASKANYIYIHREATPIGPPFVEWFLVKVLKKKVIYDFDDAIWLPNQSDANKVLVKNLKWHSKVKWICKWAYKVSAGNDFLADYVRQYNNNVFLIPTVVDTEELHNPVLTTLGSRWLSGLSLPAVGGPALPERSEGRGDILNKSEGFDENSIKKPIIGWTGTHSTLHQLDIIWPVLNELATEIPFEFHLISDQFPENLPKYVRCIKWNKESEIADLSIFNIGIMPLKENEWEKGKCAFKLIQYMALEIPSIASDLGANKEVVENDSQAILVKNTHKDWKNAFTKLLQDKDLRVSMGKEARKRIIEAYSKKAIKKEFTNLFT